MRSFRPASVLSACLVVLAVSTTPGGLAAPRAPASSPPAAPTNVSPPDGTTTVGANPQLCIGVSDPEADALEVRFFGRDLTAQPGEDFTFIALPDTQFYSQSHPQIYFAQTQWIIDNKASRNIVFVSQLGDCVHNEDIQREWDVANQALSMLEDPVTTMLPEGIPFAVVVGNHDNGGNGGTLDDQYAGSASVLYNQTFGVPRFEGREYYAGHFGVNNDNHYQLFSAGGMDFVIVHTEYDQANGELQQAVLDWADDLMQTHGDRRAILASHYLLNPDGTFGNGEMNEGTQGQDTYDALKGNPNLFLMLCAHLWANPHRSDTYDGNTIHTLMSNYHDGGTSGAGWMRIMTFRPSQNQIEVETYSPHLEQWDTDAEEQFTLFYDMENGLQFQTIGSVSAVPSGSTACLYWPGHQDGARYEWYATVSDGSSTTTGPRWIFDSTGACVLPSDCDDGDPCTSDSCDSNVCGTVPIPNCCVTDGDCDDGNQCTLDACDEGTCTNSNHGGPCTDGDACTVADTCFEGTCSGSLMNCDDGNDCTADSCDDGACVSAYAPSATCCAVDSHCDDGDLCTTDSCGVGGDCVNDLDPDCCRSDAECVDGDSCTADLCTTNSAALYLNGIDAHVTTGEFGQGSQNNRYLNAEQFTIECWFKWNGGGVPTATSNFYNDSGGIEAYALVTKGRDQQDVVPTSDINYFMGILETGHVLVADMEEDASGANPGLNHPVTGSTVINPGVWHHAAVTYNGCCWQLYLDGQPETDGTDCPGEPPNFSGRAHFAIGTGQRRDGDSEGSFGGWIDEVRVWKRALSPGEIQANLHRQIKTAPDLLGRWGFNEGSGYVADESTGSKFDGRFVMAEWATSDLPVLGDGSCSFPPIQGCCATSGDCDDGNACSTDNCNSGSCENHFSPTAGCCAEDAQCDDGDPCTQGTCDGAGTCTSAPLDTDGDQLLDCLDDDDDNDGMSDVCDNCVLTPNVSQADRDADFVGDHCDSNDGLIYLWFEDKTELTWQQEAGFDAWNSYMGDLGVLKSSGVYTQVPGSGDLVGRSCNLSDPSWSETGTIDPGAVAFFMTTGVSSGVEGGLGTDSAGSNRPNDNPCP